MNRLTLFAILTLYAQLICGAETKEVFVFGELISSSMRNYLPDSKEAPAGVDYPRDCSFPLPHVQNIQYIPRNVSREDILKQELAIIVLIHSTYADEFGLDCANSQKWLSDTNGNAESGKGFIEKQQILETYFDERSIRYKKPGDSIIEGANIFFIKTPDNRYKAVVGYNSVVIGFLYNNFYKSESISMTHSEKPYYYTAMVEPLLRMTDEEWAIKIDPILDNGLSPLDDKKKRALKKAAEKIANRIAWCKQKIADEIELDPRDIIFIPQRRFHIDFDLFITTQQKIFLRAPDESVKGENAIWSAQKEILEKSFPESCFVSSDHDFYNPFACCGLVNNKENCFYCFSTNDSSHDSSFRSFLINECGFESVMIMAVKNGFAEDMEAGLHCFSQEYVVPKINCSNCGKSKKLFACSRCKRVSYCNRACQSADWNKHKLNCSAQLKK